MINKRIEIPKQFHDIDENWKNAVHLLKFEEADRWYEKRTLLIPEGEEANFVSEEEYYYTIAAVYFYDRNDIIKSKSICNRAVERNFKSTRILDLKMQIEAVSN